MRTRFFLSLKLPSLIAAIVIPFGAVELLGAPVALAADNRAAQAEESQPAESSVIAASNIVAPSASTTIGAASADAVSKDRAKVLAEMHLTLRNTRWGAPTGVREEGDRYVFTYETPEKELRLFGLRSATVRKASGIVKVRDE